MGQACSAKKKPTPAAQQAATATQMTAVQSSPVKASLKTTPAQESPTHVATLPNAVVEPAATSPTPQAASPKKTEKNSQIVSSLLQTAIIDAALRAQDTDLITSPLSPDFVAVETSLMPSAVSTTVKSPTDDKQRSPRSPAFPYDSTAASPIKSPVLEQAPVAVEASAKLDQPASVSPVIEKTTAETPLIVAPEPAKAIEPPAAEVNDTPAEPASEGVVKPQRSSSNVGKSVDMEWIPEENVRIASGSRASSRKSLRKNKRK
jgi:hypothetical protein